MQIADPSGETWRVKRRWLPWRWRRRDPDNLSDVAVPDIGDDLVIGLVLLVGFLLLLIFLPIVLVLVIAVAELFLLLFLLPAFLLLRAFKVGRWPVEVWYSNELEHTEAVRGWGASKQRMIELADDVRFGRRRPASRSTGDLLDD